MVRDPAATVLEMGKVTYRNGSRYFACRSGLECVCLRIGWFKGGHLSDREAQLEELAELVGGPAQDYMRAMWLSRHDALQIFRAACVTTALPEPWPRSATGPWAVAYAVSANAKGVFDLGASVDVLGYRPVDDYDAFASTLLGASQL